MDVQDLNVIGAIANHFEGSGEKMGLN